MRSAKSLTLHTNFNAPPSKMGIIQATSKKRRKKKKNGGIQLKIIIKYTTSPIYSQKRPIIIPQEVVKKCHQLDHYPQLLLRRPHTLRIMKDILRIDSRLNTL